MKHPAVGERHLECLGNGKRRFDRKPSSGIRHILDDTIDDAAIAVQKDLRAYIGPLTLVLPVLHFGPKVRIKYKKQYAFAGGETIRLFVNDFLY